MEWRYEGGIELQLKRLPDPVFLPSFDRQKLVPTFPWIDNCLMATKQDFLENGSITMIKWEIKKMEVSQKAGCLPYAVGKQLPIPIINRG